MLLIPNTFAAHAITYTKVLDRLQAFWEEGGLEAASFRNSTITQCCLHKLYCCQTVGSENTLGIYICISEIRHVSRITSIFRAAK